MSHDKGMIVFASLGLMVYELVAVAIGSPKVTDLSHHPRWGFLIWGWWGWLALHFLAEKRRCDASNPHHQP